MTRALAFLLVTSIKNLLALRLRRLKQPKYLVGAIVGGLYFFYFVGMRLFFLFRGGHAPSGFLSSPEGRMFYESFAALILLGIVLLSWIIPGDRAALVFTEAEIAFLFPAPVGRKTLIHYKLIKSQIGILVTSLLLTLVFRGSTGSPAWIRAIGWWVAFSTLNLHRLAASFVRTMLLDRGIANWIRRVAVLALAGGAAAFVIIWTAHTVPPPPQDLMNGPQDFSGLQHYLTHALSAGPLPWLLYPFRLVVRPYLALDAHAFLLAIGPPLLILAAHYWWVVRANVAFEEASVEASQKMAERIATIRANRGQFTAKPTKKKRPPFQLRPTGLPAVGFLWKNLLAAGQSFTPRFWLLCVWLVVIALMISSINSRTADFRQLAGLMSLIFLPMSIFAGPQLLRQDFRQDLAMADVLKTYPLSGWQVALGELLAPAAILTGVQWLLVILAAGLNTSFGHDALPLEWRLGPALGLAILLPALNLVILLIPNAAALLFPGWIQTGRGTPQGIEVLGQRLIFMLGQLVVFVVALVPAALVFAGIFLVLNMFVGLGPLFSLPAAALGAATMLSVEAWLGLIWLGRLFENFDLSAEMRG